MDFTEEEMTTWPEPASVHEMRPKTIKYCKVCERDTPHQIRDGQGLVARICVLCLNRALIYELDRD
jgi:hypothetical protein